ncbi:SGNH/GDSL hydrolase family protein [Subtercola boreus]|uniref:SGNH hydrolase-type esterase domain-containing protein n=1 Tax=Subtercola boreus TaxID=120213 RepID=A0A3E0W924_9MICO|nr:GDSL-type esterase/lipase family protein [Subtercola boreus]RFA18752.1 hypothetical protein B7R24_13470 [Subtercola boreus]RFA18869.1 hypothetical protein B7R23_13460 [Subtercola boreus]RFA25404.1 hypothetical protein B7R25_13570 [Subtercola boreus]
MLERRRLLAVSATLAAALSLAVLSGCTSTPPSSTPGPIGAGTSAATAVPVEPPVRVAVVGDSNSTGHQGDIDTGIANGNAWIAQVGTADIDYVGGWARDGATSTLMAEQVQPVDDADVVVIMAGTNDLAVGISLDQLNDDIVSIVGTVGAKNVVIAAIPPITARPAYAPEANASLAALAADKGWFFHDGWTNLRTADGVWSAQYKLDGIHTTKAGYGVFGRDIGEYVLATFVTK